MTSVFRTSTFKAVIPLLSGLLFGAGLIVSGMTDPQRVIGFLDVAGHWNPALALVMGGAVLVTLPAFAWARRGGRTVFGDALSLPERRTITRPLITGSILFGIGWGLSGVCPGPGLLLAAGAGRDALLFAASMLAGMFISDLQRGLKRSDRAEPVPAVGECG
ncbi:DUF6691 family protein [Sinimarinibacterium sp. CAU 1509]|uniref:DUF6691 family protein n=1 Tax=Sinimarinibacterium sp. CAU 1509 TaxID=2562283 RepID=UPI001B7FAB55|nr:DUF6691 family protein [Sinimarinibacterium sp. CAU 1509]